MTDRDLMERAIVNAIRMSLDDQPIFACFWDAVAKSYRQRMERDGVDVDLTDSMVWEGLWL